MTKHTPGPWYYTKTPIVGFMVRSSSAKSDTGRDKFVADCGKVHHDPFSEEFEANAALIAAAPELLDALNKIKTALAVGRNVGEDKEQAYQDAEEIADFAIAKAEGKA